MLLVGILVKVEIAIALVELALLTFRHCLQLQLFNPPESPKVITSLVHEALESRIDVSHGNGKAFFLASPRLSGRRVH